MRTQKSTNQLLPALLTPLLLLSMTSQADAQQLIKFDAPNAGSIAFGGTAPAAINQLGAITGSVIDNNGGTHGFAGTLAFGFTDFDAPGADPIVGGTFPAGINDLGVIAGTSVDTNGLAHGFVRLPNSHITTFDDSQAPVAGPGQGTNAQALNDLGEITGYYIDGNNVVHGFVRSSWGAITTFDAPGANGLTLPQSINNLGVIAGVFNDANGVDHGFVRAVGGEITTFDPTHSFNGPTSFGTYSAYINDLGAIAGSYFDDTTYVEYGYVRSPDGHYAEFAAPRAGTVVTSSDEAGTNVTAVNLEGSTTGNALDNNFESHSFVRAASGADTSYDVPGQIQVPDQDAGSIGLAINDLGVVLGRWRDSNETFHGYLRIP